MAVLGELLINLKADTASLARDLAEAKSKVADAVEGIKGTLESLGVGLGLAELGRQFKDAISESVELGVTMENLAQRSGLSVEAMSGLSFAAKQSHVDAEALATGLKKLSVNMLDAATGTGQAAKFFQALGVSVTDVGGRLRPTEDVLMQLADVFHDLPDGAEKTALAVKLFGRSGSEMIPLLNQGRAGIQAFREEAQRAGVVIGEDFAKAAEQMEQKVNAMKAAWQGLAISFTESVMPLLNLKTFAGATNPLVSITQGVLDLKNALHGAGEEAKSAGSWFDKGLEAAQREQGAGHRPDRRGFQAGGRAGEACRKVARARHRHQHERRGHRALARRQPGGHGGGAGNHPRAAILHRRPGTLRQKPGRGPAHAGAAAGCGGSVPEAPGG
jgi:hypothetical protein